MTIARCVAPGASAWLYVASLCLAALGLAADPGGAIAQSAAANYPSKPVRIVIPLAPGGPVDTFGRMYANFLGKKYPQPFIVENKPGAGQSVGAAYVVTQPGDGYTLLAASNSLIYESLVNKDAPYNSAKDIVPYGVFAGSGMFLQIHPSLPVTNVAEFVAWVRANPGKLNLGTAAAPLAQFEGLRDLLGLKWTYVTYKGGSPAETALLAGDVQAYFGDSKGLQMAKAGRLRVLAYSGPQRHPNGPDVPTFAESGIGVPDFNYVLWIGMYTVPAVPESITTRLNAELNEMARDPEILKLYRARGYESMPMTVDAVRKDALATNNQIAEMLARGLKLR